MKPYLIAAALVLALIAGAFFAGRWTAPPPQAAQTEYLERVRQVVVTVYKDRVKHVTRHIVAVKTPDGAETTTTDETEHEEEHVQEKPPPPAEVAAVIKATNVSRPGWRAGVTVGLTFDQPSVTVRYGGLVERRLLGPIWLGVNANSAPYVGAQIAVEF